MPTLSTLTSTNRKQLHAQSAHTQPLECPIKRVSTYCQYQQTHWCRRRPRRSDAACCCSTSSLRPLAGASVMSTSRGSWHSQQRQRHTPVTFAKCTTSHTPHPCPSPLPTSCRCPLNETSIDVQDRNRTLANSNQTSLLCAVCGCVAHKAENRRQHDDVKGDCMQRSSWHARHSVDPIQTWMPVSCHKRNV